MLDCAEGRELPPPRRVDAEDDADLFARVGELRELGVDDGPVPLDRLDDEVMTARVAEAFGGYDEEDAALELRLLAALGTVPPDADLRRLRVDVFAEQVSGLYQRGEQLASVRMREPGGALSPLEQVVAAHELQHALADRHLGRPSQQRDGPENADERRASLALVEGDASLTMHLYVATSLEPEERDDLRAQLLQRAEGEPLADYPPFLREQLRFPYIDGLAFVCDRWVRGGWAAVDAVYAEPPASTAQILWPERYDEGEAPLDVPAPRAPGAPWEEVRDDAFGAAELDWLLSSQDDAGAATARQRAAAWAGGRAVTWADGDRSAVALALVQRVGEPSLCATMADWWAAEAASSGEPKEGAPPAGGERGADGMPAPDGATPAAQEGGEALRLRADNDRIGVVHCEGDRVGVGIAPDLATARRIAAP